jgi:hypothetical protein
LRTHAIAIALVVLGFENLRVGARHPGHVVLLQEGSP